MNITQTEEGFFVDGEKVAMIDKNGHLKMAKGHAAKREDIQAWQDAQVEIEEAPEEQAEPEPRKPVKDKGIPPCPPSDPRAGDKTPEVVAWWFKYHPKEAESRYANRKFTRP